MRHRLPMPLLAHQLLPLSHPGSFSLMSVLEDSRAQSLNLWISLSSLISLVSSSKFSPLNISILVIPRFILQSLSFSLYRKRKPEFLFQVLNRDSKVNMFKTQIIISLSILLYLGRPLQSQQKAILSFQLILVKT